MHFSVLDLLKVGIGPSSSHTIGPMIAAKKFVDSLEQQQLLSKVSRLKVTLFGSLAFTGEGHGTMPAIMLGLEGYRPIDAPLDRIKQWMKLLNSTTSLTLLNRHTIDFHPDDFIKNIQRQKLYHPNTMEFKALDASSNELFTEEYYSVGGGFVQSRTEVAEINHRTKTSRQKTSPSHNTKEVPYPFQSARELFKLCRQHKLTVDQLMMANEQVFYPASTITERLDEIYHVMMDAIDRGLKSSGVLSGGLFVRKRAKALYDNLNQLTQKQQQRRRAQLTSHMTHSYLSAWALAVSEENADFGRIVTSPTCGSCGVMPAVLRFYRDILCKGKEQLPQIREFILVAGAIGLLFKNMASISGAEVGCQGEVGVAASMSAAALTAVSGGNFAQIESAARASITHFLGLTCDPIKGLVQIPCIERNAVAACQAVDVSQLALLEQNPPTVFSLDQAITTMKETGLAMDSRYRETSLAGLAALDLSGNDPFLA